MANSFTGVINTNGEFVTVESVTVGVEGSNFTGFTIGKFYNIQVQNLADFKVGDAIFTLGDRYQFLIIKARTDTLYIKTDVIPAKLTILEEEKEQS